MTAEDVRKAGCNVEALTRLRAAGVTAAAIRNISGCSVDQLTAAGFTAQDLGNAGYSTAEIKSKGQVADCSVQSLAAARAKGVSAATIKQTMGCSAKAMKDAGYSAADLKNAGFSAAELKNAGFGLNDLKNAGFGAKELNAAGFTAQQLKDAGFSAAQLKGAGFNAAELKAAGIGADELRKAGFSAKDVKDAGFTQDQIKKAGYANQELKDAGFSAMPGLDTITPSSGVPSTIANFPALEGITPPAQASVEDANAKRLDDIRSQQEKQMAAQRYQQKIQQRGSAMLAGANQLLQGWKTVPQQVYTAGTEKEGNEKGMSPGQSQGPGNHGLNGGSGELGSADNQSQGVAVIKTGDILFAVIDTSVNSDEPGPILATIVSGRLKGSKLIGSFNLPNRADKMIVTFNTLSVLGADKTVSITAFAIDPNTARTALSSQTDHHYLSRYGSLFASTFLEGFGNAFQSSNTTITIGGTGGTTDTTVQSGIGRSTMDNAVIGLATLGKAWGQLAAQNMTRPTTVQLYAGTGVGILFTQDLRLS